MAAQRYPIGIQTFSKIIEGAYIYVDKTAYIKPLLSHGQYIFFNRPRRFGKSLLLSTLEAYFEGKRHLFKNLAVYNEDIDWTPSPVLHFDFNNGLYESATGLLVKLHDLLEYYENKFALPVGAKNRDEIPGRFSRIIQAAYEKTGRQVVILIDEYDKPLLAIEDNEEVFDLHQTLLKSFYSNLKSMDRYIRFAFITGVARFNKVSIFSDFNNLDDISLENAFADVCGWSENELLESMKSGISALAEEREEEFDTTLNTLRKYYDGYLFTRKGSRLYNPYSILRSLKAKSIEPYWFETGTPTFLAKRVKDIGTFPPDLDGQFCTHKELMAVGLNSKNPIPMMFQTGYLTIGSYNPDMDLYQLRFPNHEVEVGFYQELLPVYAPSTDEPNSVFNFKKFMLDLFQGKPDDFMKRLATLLKDLPGEDHCESTYRAVTYLLTVLCAPRSLAEHHGYKGRSDIEVITPEFIYIFEFKYNKSTKEAMEQIHTRDYAGRYEMDPRPVYLIASNYIEKKEERGLHYEIKLMQK